jgi:hypothetical protein
MTFSETCIRITSNDRARLITGQSHTSRWYDLNTFSFYFTAFWNCTGLVFNVIFEANVKRGRK